MTRQKAQERHRAAIIFGAILLLAAGAAFAALIGPYAPVKQTMPLTASHDFRGAIMTEAFDGKGCSLQVFDNQTGRMVRSEQSCETTTYDSNGVPIPTGTIHRLDAISKSFHGP